MWSAKCLFVCLFVTAKFRYKKMLDINCMFFGFKTWSEALNEHVIISKSHCVTFSLIFLFVFGVILPPHQIGPMELFLFLWRAVAEQWLPASHTAHIGPRGTQVRIQPKAISSTPSLCSLLPCTLQAKVLKNIIKKITRKKVCNILSWMLPNVPCVKSPGTLAIIQLGVFMISSWDHLWHTGPCTAA